jgi:ATP-binding cassette subfamily F protein uup
MQAPNILLLDEPTNDLDIQTLTIFEEYLESFNGAVIVISHDRFFIEKVADLGFVFIGDGVIEKRLGDFFEYTDQSVSPPPTKKTSDEAGKVRNQPDRKLKFSFKEQYEFDNIDAEIAELEQKIEELKVLIQDSSSDYMKLQELMTQKEDLNHKLEEKMERWIYLHELAEKIACQGHVSGGRG